LIKLTRIDKIIKLESNKEYVITLISNLEGKTEELTEQIKIDTIHNLCLLRKETDLLYYSLFTSK